METIDSFQSNVQHLSKLINDPEYYVKYMFQKNYNEIEQKVISGTSIFKIASLSESKYEWLKNFGVETLTFTGGKFLLQAINRPNTNSSGSGFGGFASESYGWGSSQTTEYYLLFEISRIIN
ncbi:MAG: hypothetical protein MUO21_09420 [Nitrososphaeraceae archaeon]|nr:hypothetical protein [Nitrososphaeraceae archaeon]